MNPPTSTHHPESLEARVIWLHDVGGLSGREIAWRLGVPEPRVARILAQRSDLALAVAPGASMPGPSAALRELTRGLIARFGLRAALVAAPQSPMESVLETVSRAGASFLADEIRRNAPGRLIGLSHGRTIAGAASAIPRIRAGHVRFVSLLGDLTAQRSAYPHEVMYTLARRLGSEAYIMPAPLYLSTREEKETLERISFIRDIQTLQAAADTLILGIGRVDVESQLLTMGMMEQGALEGLIRAGAAGEIMGRFLDPEGVEIRSDLACRTISPPIESLRGRRVVGMAGGPGKITAIRATLSSGIITELVTDQATAEALVG